MTLSRVLGGVGRTFISMGLILLLFVAYQLWGTGIQEARAQGALEDDLDQLLDAASDLPATDSSSGPESDGSASDDEPTDDGSSGDADGDDGGGDGEAPEVDDRRPFELLASEAPEDLEFSPAEIDLVWRPRGDASFRLSIPRINVSKIVVEGVSTDDLRKGPGHYPSTPIPGQPGNAAIAGHRTTYGAPFNRIDELKPGDEIYVETVQGTFTYRVVTQADGLGHFIVSPDRVEVLSQDNADHPNRLTLTACHPKYSAAQRIIVVAELVGEPVVAVPRPDSAAPASDALASEDVDGSGDTADDAGAEGDGGTDGTEAGDGTDEAPVADDEATDDGQDGDGQDGDEEPVAGVISSDDGFGSGDPGGTDEVAAAPVAEDSFGEGLNGDSGAVAPSVVWALTAAMIWFTAWFVGRRWRKWPSYVLGFAPFMVVLFVCFVHVDQALPSY